MEFTPIGFVCLLAGLLIVARPMTLGLPVFAAFLPLQTAAAVNLWSIGGLSLVCAHILVGALVAAIALRPRVAAAAVREATARPAVILLFAFVCYALFSAFFMPRLFEGGVHVYSLARPTDGTLRVSLSPLHPTSGNITQSFYVALNLLLFGVIVFIIGRRGDMRQATFIINTATAVHLFFALISMAPTAGPVAAILDFVRTANYSILTHHTVAGMKRIIGSYAEASAFGATSMGLFAWNFLRFLQTRGLWHLAASLLLLGCIVVSFSTTAYAVMSLLIIIWSLHTVYTLVRRGLSADHLTALFSSALASALLIAFLFYEPLRLRAYELVEILFGRKLQSASGIERSAWNMQALSNFVETFGLGVGLGSARTSSLATALLSNVGAVGALLYLGFLGQSFLRPWRRSIKTPETGEAVYARRIFVAARGGALAMLLSHIIAGGLIDGGLAFFVFAGLAAAAIPQAKRQRLSREIMTLGSPATALWYPRRQPQGEIAHGFSPFAAHSS
ncbi:MAG: hypothetical protein ACOZAA_12145 [Pseudomonadota bacterium]